MAWDDDKSTAADPDNPSADEQLSADEWDAHVADQKGHSTRHESGGSDEIGLGNLSLPAGAQIDEESGDFVVRDSGGNVVLRYDEASGAWQLNALEANKLKHNISDGEEISRSADTEYQNTTGDVIKLQVLVVKSNAITGRIDIRLHVSNSAGGTAQRNDIDAIRTTSTGDRIVYLAQAEVPDGGYYELETFGDADEFNFSRRTLS